MRSACRLRIGLGYQAHSLLPRLWAERDGPSAGAADASVRATNRYFNRRLLVTTVTLESAMAAAASMGESRPSAATGIPTVL